MISKHIFESTFSLATAQALKIWADNNIISENPYLETVFIPEYDSGIDTHVLITTSNGNESLLNDDSKQHFYVEPGDYSSTTWVLTEDGDAENRRTISLLNGNDTHTGALTINTTNLARIQIEIDGNFWILDRMAAWDVNNDGEIKIWGTDNIINRFLADSVNQGVMIRHLAHRNTVQRSRFQNQVIDDGGAIEINEWNGSADLECHDCKFIENEIYKCNDGIQIVRVTNSSDPEWERAVNVEGLVIDNNRIQLDVDNASFENAIDMKGGSHDVGNPVTISNNFMQGYHESVDKSAMVLHKRPANINITNNVFYNSGDGINTGSSGLNIPEGDDAGMQDGTISGNLFYTCGQASMVVNRFSDVGNVQFEDNVIINGSSYWGSFYGCTSTSTYQNNDICNSGDIDNWEDRGGSNSSTFLATLANNDIYATSSLGGYTEDLVIDYDLYTASPQQATLVNAVKP